MKDLKQSEINTSSTSIEVYNHATGNCDSLDETVRTIEAIECVRKNPRLFAQITKEEVLI